MDLGDGEPTGPPRYLDWKLVPEVRTGAGAMVLSEHEVVEAAGSDVDVTPINPWWGFWAAVARRELQSGQGLAPEERITIEQTLTLYTRNGAYAGFEEAFKG